MDVLCEYSALSATTKVVFKKQIEFLVDMRIYTAVVVTPNVATLLS